MKSLIGEKFTEINVDHFGCVDGRPAIFVLEQKNGEYGVQYNTEQAKKLNYPQLLGAALGFVAAAETKLGLSMEESFDLVEESLSKIGLKPSIHVDDDHGKLAKELQDLYSQGKTKKLVNKILGLIKGCGFAAYQWGDKADSYIEEAIKRGWIIQVLTGNHKENKGGSFINKGDGTSLDVAIVNEQNIPAFNFDTIPVSAVLQTMSKLANDESFADQGLIWLLENYEAVVVALGGVQDKSEIQTVK